MDFKTLKDLEILFGLAIVTVILFRRFSFPSVIGFLATGIVAGPHALALISDPHAVEKMAEAGVVLLLFTIGMEISIGELARMRKLIVWGGSTQVGVTILAMAGIGMAVGLPANQALFAGFLVALSSTAIVIKLLMDAGELDTPQGKTALGILIFQDLCIVPLMILTPFLAGKGDGWMGIIMALGKAAAVVAIAHGGARYAVPWIFSQVVKTRSRELFILTLIFIGFGAAWLTALAGLSLALGAFIAGLAVSESEYSQQALGDIIPFRDAFMSLFFISVGMLLDVSIFLNYPLLVGAVVVSIILIKTLVASASTMLLGLPARVAAMSGIAVAQIGEFSFVLAQSGLQHGLLPQAGYQLFLAASVMTMALTPFLLRGAPELAQTLTRFLPRRLVRGSGRLVGSERKVRLHDHVIIAGYGLNGRNLARVLRHHKLPYVIVEANPFTVTSERKKGDHIVFGDATRPEVLEHLQVERARLLVVAISDAAASRRIAAVARQVNPRLHIIVRTRYLLEMEPLYQLGVNEVVPEEFETSIEIFARVLRKYLVAEGEIEECVASVRKDSYDMFRSMSRRHSHAVGISGFLAGAEVGAFQVGKGSELAGQSLREGTIRSRSGSSVLVIKREDEVVPNPDPVWQLHEGDMVLLLGTPEQLAAAGRLFEPKPAPL